MPDPWVHAARLCVTTSCIFSRGSSFRWTFLHSCPSLAGSDGFGNGGCRRSRAPPARFASRRSVGGQACCARHASGYRHLSNNFKNSELPHWKVLDVLAFSTPVNGQVHTSDKRVCRLRDV